MYCEAYLPSRSGLLEKINASKSCVVGEGGVGRESERRLI